MKICGWRALNSAMGKRPDLLPDAGGGRG